MEKWSLALDAKIVALLSNDTSNCGHFDDCRPLNCKNDNLLKTQLEG